MHMLKNFRLPSFAVLGVGSLTIRVKLLLLAGFLIAIMVGANTFMRTQVFKSSDALHGQAQLQEAVAGANAALRSFGELKYWLADLEVSWLTESEEMAEAARSALDEQLKAIPALAPNQVAEISAHVGKLVELSMQAVDAYVDENRVQGNGLVADARASVQAVDEILVKFVGELKQEALTSGQAAVAEADRTAQIALIILIVAGLAGLILTWSILRSILTPLNQMIGAMNELAGNNNIVEIPALGRKDEIGNMAQAVQIFKDNAIERERLEAEAKTATEERATREQQEQKREQEEAERERQREAEQDKREREREEQQRQREIEQERQREEERKAVLRQMADSFEASVGGVVGSVSSAASQMQSTSALMSAGAEQAGQQAASVAAASEEATGNVQTVAAAAEELSSSIAEISRQVAESSKITDRAVTEAEHTNGSVQGLAEAAQNIGEVVNLINDIASQTNLLALNATIEAARAGEAGKGFAVVASEVKSLANQTAGATQEIASQIASMQEVTGGVVGAIEGIGKTIAEVNEIASGIAAAVEEQGAATQEIARNVQEAAQGTQDVTSHIGGVTQAVGDTGQAAGQVLEAADELTRQADALREEVDKFLTDVRAA